MTYNADGTTASRATAGVATSYSWTGQDQTALGDHTDLDNDNGLRPQWRAKPGQGRVVRLRMIVVAGCLVLGACGHSSGKGEAVEDSAAMIEGVLRDHLAKADAVFAELPADREVEALKATVTERRWGGLASFLSEDWPDRYDISGRGTEIARFELVSMSNDVAVTRSRELQFIQDVPVGEDDGEGLIGAGLPIGLKHTFVLRDGRWLLDETVYDRTICDGVAIVPPGAKT
jgi:hypothetical protein